MAESELCFLTASEMARQVRSHEVSPVELVQAHLERIERLNPTLTAFIHLDADRALEQARAMESRPAVGRLYGVPVAYKDIYDVAGMPTTAGSRTRLGRIAARDSTVAERLHAAGAICLGKLNTFEFASGSMEVFGDARNPWNLARSPGGSSSGSGAALAARLVPLATGSDTGGSIRIPASFCGLAGIRPTHGLVSRAGVVPLSWSLDSAGPMARTVQDVALMLEVMAGHDSLDPSTVRRPAPELIEYLDDAPRAARLGVPRQFFFDSSVDTDVLSSVRQALRILESIGAELVEVDLRTAEYGLAASWAIAYSEAFAYHREQFFAQPRQFTAAFLHKISGAALLSAEECLTAMRVRERVTTELAEVFRSHRLDAIVTPTTPYTAFEHGVAPLQDMGRLTRPFSLSGFPSLSVPCGVDAHGMPIGMQMVGRPWGDLTILQLGHAYQSLTAWHDAPPPFTDRPAAASINVASDPSQEAIEWVLARARTLGLDYIETRDAAPIAASIGPIRSHIESWRALLTDSDLPAIRPVPSLDR